jgi:myo-inositol catabolism protein IolC
MDLGGGSGFGAGTHKEQRQAPVREVAAGYANPLAVMAFDHRSTFARLLGTTWPLSSPDRETAQRLKRVILDGLVRAVQAEPAMEGAAALIDEELAGELADAVRKRNLLLVMPVEATGADVLDFAYGDAFAEHIERFGPDLVKVLLRRNPRAPSPAQAIEDERLTRLIDWARSHAYPVILELVVPADASGLQEPGSRERFDRDLRPGLMTEVMTRLQDSGVEPDVWKLEGLDRTDDCEAVAGVAQRDGRARVRCVVLGRGAETTQVLDWLQAARAVEAYSGFAIGRSLWWSPLRSLIEGQIGAGRAADLISENYLSAYRTFFEGRSVRA